MFEITDTQKIGYGLAVFGIFNLFLGVILLFDEGVLLLGNILLVAGFACVMGLRRSFSFLFQRQKMKGTATFIGGIIIITLGWPIVGMIIETYGFIYLISFSSVLPIAISFLRNLPVVGYFINKVSPQTQPEE